MSTYRHLFGPVPSRRFGRSLGVDLTPFKTCTLNCIFCQLGHTPSTTMQRLEYVPTDEVFAELDAWLQTGIPADTIALSGSGEPALHSRTGGRQLGGSKWVSPRLSPMSERTLDTQG